MDQFHRIAGVLTDGRPRKALSVFHAILCDDCLVQQDDVIPFVTKRTRERTKAGHTVLCLAPRLDSLKRPGILRGQ